MEPQDLAKSEAELAGFVDRGTQLILQEAIKKVVESFQQTDALEDILKYLEEVRTQLQTQDSRIKDLEQVLKQSNERGLAIETSMRSLLQRIQTMELQIAENSKQLAETSHQLIETRQQIAETSKHLDLTVQCVAGMAENLNILVDFFDQPPMKRLFGKLER